MLEMVRAGRRDDLIGILTMSIGGADAEKMVWSFCEGMERRDRQA